MSERERFFIAFVLISIVVLVGADLFTDAGGGASWWHLLAEGSIAVVAALGLFLLLRGAILTRLTLTSERREFSSFRRRAEEWKINSQRYLDGLGVAIDDQLAAWELSTSEKDVALLLIKGLSLKEIALARNTSEKTVRAQATSVYQKSSLSGRSELAAFFLEDLLAPRTPSSTTTNSVSPESDVELPRRKSKG